MQLCYDKIEWVIPDWKTDLNVLQVIPDKAEKKSRSSFVVSGLLLNQQQEFHRFEQMQVKGRDGYLENSRESSHPDRQQRCFPEQKFYALEKNKNVCLVIFDKYEGFGKLKGMQVTGLASIVEPFSQEYVQAADFRKIPLKALEKMPHPMNLIKIKPKKIEFVNSDFKKDGADSRQTLICD